MNGHSSILSFGLERPQPDAFYLPAAYLCHTIFFEDIRTYDNGAIWHNDSWRPSTRNCSSIELFNFQAACHAANTSKPFSPRNFDNRATDPREDDVHDDVQIISGPEGDRPRPSASRNRAHPSQASSATCEPDPRPSTSQGVFSSASFGGAKPKRKLPKKPPAPKKKTKVVGLVCFLLEPIVRR